MELFSEVYSTYYLSVRKILEEAYKKKHLTTEEVKNIIDRYAFSESAFFIAPNIEEWGFFDKGDNYKPKLNTEGYELPITNLEKCWLKAILKDSRIGLFLNKEEIEEINGGLGSVGELFDYGDFHVFDKNTCGDDFKDEGYIKNFRMLLDSIRDNNTVEIEYKNKNNVLTENKYFPVSLNYSAKDDKFRLIAFRLFDKRRKQLKLNLSSIVRVNICEGMQNFKGWKDKPKSHIVVKISNKRNALDRFLLQFAQYEKESSVSGDGSCLSKIYYDKDEETEILIRILSFGPVLKVLGPEGFVDQIRQRLRRQHRIYKDIY
ncbi:MAG: WYL domain-containing protein [Clostridiales bacterium]|jgi:hypothetical protein|nr:WYL domain-containing protein [Clostridiales bacterium]